MNARLNLHAIAQMSAERMLNCVAEGLLIALFAWMLLRVIGRRNSGTRFAVWFCALLAIAGSPFLQISSGSAAAPSAGAAFTMPRSWALYVFGAWAVMAAVGLARVAMGLWHLRKIRRNCVTLGVEVLPVLLGRTLEEFRSVRSVEVCESEDITIPTAVGFFRPVVVFPRWAMRELSVSELNAVLLHELAHLRRWDDWTNLAQKALRALFFFHPAVWWVESRLTLEREMACDDIVLAQTENPRAYAECLVSLAEKNLLRRGMALAQAAVGRMRQTTLRVLQILDAGRPNAVRVWKPAPWVVGAFSVACLVSSAHAPRLVAFGDATPEVIPQVASFRGAEHAQEAASLSGAQVVPASFVEPAPAPPVAKQRTLHSGKQRVKAVVRKANLSPSKSALQLQTAGARVVQTSAGVAEAPVPQQAVFVFMEGQPYGDSGAVLWHISVWRVTLPTNPQVAPEHSSKSI